MSSSLVGCGSANLIGNFDFTISSSPINIKALAGCYQDEDLWDISMTEGDDDRPQAC